MALYPDGGEWTLVSIQPDGSNNFASIPTTRINLACGNVSVSIVLMTIRKPRAGTLIRKVANASFGPIRIKNLPREAKRLLRSAYAVALLVE